MSELESLGNQQIRNINAKNGVGEDQFGAKLGEVRLLAKRIKSDHELSQQLWRTGNFEAMMLATQIAKPKLLTGDEVDSMAKSIPFSPNAMFSQISDWFMTNIVKVHPAKEELRHWWMDCDHPIAHRLGWSLTAQAVEKDHGAIDMDALLDRIEREMGSAPAPVQWTMNYCLASIGISSEAHRERAKGIGEKLGVYRDYPVSKGCTSPFAPIWIDEMVRRAAAG